MSLVWAALGTALFAIVLLFGAPHLAKQWAIRRLAQRCSRSRTLVLTYDDGPGPVVTTQLLDLLREYSARASFFPTGFRAEKRGELLDRVAREGHEIGCHSQDHRNAWTVGPVRTLLDVQRGYRTLARWVGSDASFRPPHGRIDLVTWVALKRQGARLAWWTLDSGDTGPTLPDAEAVVDQVLASNGGVVLMHEFHENPQRAGYVLELTRRLLEAARNARLEVETLGELLAHPESE